MALTPQSQILTHTFWSTLDEAPLIVPAISPIIEDHLRFECKELRCQVIKVAILPNHIHLLLSQPSTISISQIMKQIKGATSHFINQESYLDEKFAFQKGFESYSVSPTNASLIYEYLETQETLHQTISFQEEVVQFRKEYKKLVFWK